MGAPHPLVQINQIPLARRGPEEHPRDVPCPLVERASDNLARLPQVHLLILENPPLGDAVHNHAPEDNMISLRHTPLHHQQPYLVLLLHHPQRHLGHFPLIIRVIGVEVDVHTHRHRRSLHALEPTVLAGDARIVELYQLPFHPADFLLAHAPVAASAPDFAHKPLLPVRIPQPEVFLLGLHRAQILLPLYILNKITTHSITPHSSSLPTQP